VTSAQLASALASQMNYQYSPISATVSGSKITITSSINGAATNYPLSTSPICLTQPTFPHQPLRLLHPGRRLREGRTDAEA
jgi:hypothetical protein